MSLGVNQGGGIVFANDDPVGRHHRGAQEGRGRRHGQGQDARRGGRRPARPVLEITDQSFAPPPMPIEAKAFDAAAPAVPIQAGENAYGSRSTSPSSCR